jgi:NADPH:quinone reductase
VLERSALEFAPQGFSDDEAAAYHVGAITAYTSLVVRGALQAGETLLVHGASGGMGIPAVQLGVHLGATVIATGSSNEKLNIVKDLGAHHVLNLKHGFREQVKALTSGEGADVVYDPVGGDVFDASLPTYPLSKGFR